MRDERIDLFELTVITFTIYVLLSLIVQIFFNINQEITKLLNFFDLVSCFIFLIDWGIRYRIAKKKFKFFIRNFLDLIASIPLLFIFQYVGYLKVIRLINLFRLIKIIGGVNRIVTFSTENKFEFLKIAFVGLFILTMLTSPVLILHFEQNDGNIKTAYDALWWTWCTLTTIGYGDFYPVTAMGRIITVIVTTGGIALFGIGSTLIINNIVKTHSKDEKSTN